MRFLPFYHLLFRLVSTIAVLSGIGILLRIQRQPLTLFNGLIIADGLSYLTLITAGLLILTIPVHWQRAGQLCALSGAILSNHLAGLALGLLATFALSERWREQSAGLVLAIGYALIGILANSWQLTASGDGLNSVSFLLLLIGAALAIGGLDLVSTDPTPLNPLAALAGLAALIRLFSIGPWNLGWQLATLLVGSALALSTAWRAVTAQEALAAEEWLQRSLSGFILVAIGCASPAGITATGLLLLHLTLRRLAQPAKGVTPWAGWLLAGAIPGTLGFVAFWSASAAAMAAGIAALAIGVWSAALLCMLAAGRHIKAPERWASTAGAVASLGLGTTSPAVVRWCLRPLSDHLQGGLTRYGAIEPWGWAGLQALTSDAQTAATAPGIAILMLMILIGALAWLLSRWRTKA